MLGLKLSQCRFTILAINIDDKDTRALSGPEPDIVVNAAPPATYDILIRGGGLQPFMNRRLFFSRLAREYMQAASCIRECCVQQLAHGRSGSGSSKLRPVGFGGDI